MCPDYHIVRNRKSENETNHSWRTVEKNTRAELGRSLPTFKFEKQTDRKYEVADVHEMRFVDFDRSTTVMSCNKKVKSVASFEKSPERDKSHTVNRNVILHDYQVIET